MKKELHSIRNRVNNSNSSSVLEHTLDNSGDRTIIVKRMNLKFNNKDCEVINFTDITTYKRLKHEEETNRLLKKL